MDETARAAPQQPAAPFAPAPAAPLPGAVPSDETLEAWLDRKGFVGARKACILASADQLDDLTACRGRSGSVHSRKRTEKAPRPYGHGLVAAADADGGRGGVVAADASPPWPRTAVASTRNRGTASDDRDRDAPQARTRRSPRRWSSTRGRN